MEVTQFEAVRLRRGAEQQGFVLTGQHARAASRLPANFIDEVIARDP
jgi:hypothetical protein